MAIRKMVALGAAAAALVLAGCNKSGSGNASGSATNGPIAPIAAPNGGDWSEVIAVTPEGGFRMGNPDAPVKLVEYASLTCPHCRDFSKEASGPLTNDFVKSGRVSWEFRNFVLNPWDIAISMVQRCQGPQPSFKLIEQLYAEQESWIQNLQNVSQADQARIQGLTDLERFKALFALTQLSGFFGQRGVPQAKIDECLSNKANFDQIEQLSQRGQADGVTGTPSFFINGKLAEQAADWNTLQAQLREAIGG